MHNCLFGAVLKNTNTDINRYKRSEYELAFNSKTNLCKDSVKNAATLIIFSGDLRNSSHAENKKNNILVLCGNSIKLNDRTIQAESVLKTNCTVPNQKCVLSLHYNGDDTYLLVNGVQQYKFKTKDSEVKPNNLCLGNITGQFSASNISKTGFDGYIYYFSADYQAATIDKIQNIHAYLMKKIYILYKMSQYFPPYTEPVFVKIDLDLSNYATQKNLSNLHVKTSDFALKLEVDKLDIDKLVPVPRDLAKLSKEVQEYLTKNKSRWY